MASTFTPNKNLEKPANGDDVDTWSTPVNADWDRIDLAFGGLTTLNVVAASGTVTLTNAQYSPPFIVASGLLTANVNYQLPSGVGGFFWVYNNTTGAFTITISSAGGGTTVVIAQGKRAQILCDGTNVIFGSAAAGANADITSLSGLTTPLSVPQGGTGAATITGLVKGNGTGAFTAGTAGTDYALPSAAATWTATQAFAGSSSTLAELLTNAAEVATISATAATGTIAIYPSSQSILYFTSNASANWTVNLTFSVGTTLNTAMGTGEALTIVFLVTQGATPFYNTTVQVDGTTSGVTTKWLGGAPISGVASGVDVYSYVVLKTGTATFSVFASVASFR